MAQDSNREDVLAEIERLKEKQLASSDEDIRSALQLRIDFLEANLPPEVEEQPAPEPSAKPEDFKEPSEADLEEIERLLRQARVEAMRANDVEALRLAEKALSIGGQHVGALESKGDALVALGRTSEARNVFAKAKEIDPSNAGVERKFAETVLQTSDTISIEDQLASGLSESMFLMPDDQVAGSMTATLLTILLPGLGHIVLGLNVVGGVILSAWVLLSIWLVILREDLGKLIQFAVGKPVTPNMGVAFPLFLLVVLYIGSIASLSKPKQSGSRKGIDHPRPPVDLPFD